MPGRQFSTHLNNSESIDALHDGVPPWMKNSLDDWLRTQLSNSQYRGRTHADEGLLRRLERLLRTDLTNQSHDARSMLQIIFSKMNENTELKLDIVDAILQLTGNQFSGKDTLASILTESGSKWKVVSHDGNYSLEERVDSTVVAALDDLSEQEGDASSYMVEAWNNTFGRSPNPSTGYSNTIKAVEAACWQIITPSDSRATLGTMIRELTNHPEGFQVAIREKQTHKGIETIRQDMSLIWEGQTDRHGTSNPTPPSQAATEQAVFIGISLCQQFIRELVKLI